MLDKPKDTIILKCESQKRFAEISKRSNVWELMLSVASTYSYNEDRYKVWTFVNKNELVSYLNNKHIICFNGVRFDLPLILGSDFKCDPTFILESKENNFFAVATDLFYKSMLEIYKCNVYSNELFDKMNKHPIPNMKVFSLYNMYTCTLNEKVPDDILNFDAIDSFKQKKNLSVVVYNLHRNRIIKKLYEFICQHGYVINGDYDILKLSNIPKPKNLSIDMFLPF